MRFSKNNYSTRACWILDDHDGQLISNAHSWNKCYKFPFLAGVAIIAIITVALTVVVVTPVKFAVSHCQRYPSNCTRVLLSSNYCRENSARVQKVPINKSSLPQSSKKCLKYIFRKMRGNSRLFWNSSTLFQSLP